MRITRVKKFKKYRQQQLKKLMLYGFVLPVGCLLVGYILSSLFILPSMASK